MIVRADRGLILAAIASAPPVFRLTLTNPQRALTVGGRHIHFGMVSGAPNVHDIAGGRRSGNFEDYKKLIKLGQSFNIQHFSAIRPWPRMICRSAPGILILSLPI